MINILEYTNIIIKMQKCNTIEDCDKIASEIGVLSFFVTFVIVTLIVLIYLLAKERDLGVAWIILAPFAFGFMSGLVVWPISYFISTFYLSSKIKKNKV